MKCISFFTLALLGLSVCSPIRAGAAPHWIAERPSNLGHPQDGTRRGGGSRGGECDLPEGRAPLTALMPDTAIWTDIVGGPELVMSYTHRPSPELWFYLPYRLDSHSQVEFVLQNTAGDTLSRAWLDTALLPPAPSIIQVSLAALGLSLSPDTGYHWYLTVHCQGGPPVSVDGWLNYQPLNPSAPPEPTDTRFFVDSVSALVQAQLLEPDSTAASDFLTFLNSVSLGDIAETPPVNCCSFVEQTQN